ncbi:SHOCT domain-containing protein [Planococcus halotolerans]|uniref:SHOCT domain-containing protein n=1 Tax=Planococcus halotolerans TaxID=2233542 RepID=UPI001F2B7ACD|nr:SHOCT domain-containing protein [Planococcus halotolerans]
MSMMGGGMILSMVFWIIAVSLIIYGIVLFTMKQATKKENSSPVHKREDSSLEILYERFARGEIDEQEFDERKVFLQNKE